jgi:hypothetical protein
MKMTKTALTACAFALGLLLTQPACERMDPNVIFPEYMAKKAAQEKEAETAPSDGERTAPTFFEGQSIQ